jgi:hypothetical protein
VADSQELMESANLESFENLRTNLAFYQQRIEDMPMVFQYNKRDLKNVLPVEKLNDALNFKNQPYFEAVARSGRGVIETLRDISSLTLVRIKEALEHATVSPQNVAIHFDVDASNRIYKLKDLPMKKIGLEDLPEVAAAPAAPQPAPPPAAGPPMAAAPAPATLAGELLTAAREVPREKASTKSLNSLLSQFEDPTRITKIEKLSGANGRLTVDIKGHDGGLLRSFNVDLDPETRKVNIILDVTT